MPNPGVSAFASSCRISPNKRGSAGAEVDDDDCLVADGAERDVCRFDVLVAFGRLMRLAKDCALLDIWSCGTNLDRWEPVDACVVALVADSVAFARSDAYEEPWPNVADRP